MQRLTSVSNQRVHGGSDELAKALPGLLRCIAASLPRALLRKIGQDPSRLYRW